MTTLTELLGTELPILQAPMAGSQGSALAIASCEAGALGALPCAMLAPDAIVRELAAITAATARPFNVNFFCHTAPEPDAERDAAWLRTLSPYYAEFGLDPSSVPAGQGRRAFDAATAALIEPFRPRVLSFHFGLPPLALLERCKAWGAVVLSSATTVEEAVWLEANGVDAVIAQGLEAGGHRGHFLSEDLSRQSGTFALLPQVVRAVRVPVIAAGGIADARTVAAAFALGAAGVQVGTAFLCCPEATTSPVHRAALRTAQPGNTALTRLFSGRPARGLVNRLMRELGPMHPAAPAFPLAAAALAPLRAEAEAQGQADFSPLWCGQAAQARDLPAAQVVQALADGLPNRASHR